MALYVSVSGYAVTYIGLRVCLRRLVGSVDPSLTQAQLHQAVDDFNR